MMKGGKVSGRSDMSYAYEAGVGVMQVGDGAVVITWPAGNTALVATPSTARTDVIYASADGGVRVGTEGVVNEATAIVLDRMAAPAGMTATTQATRVRSRNFAVPYGASLGYIMGYQEWRNGPVPQAETMFTGGFWVPTDSWIDLHVNQAIYTEVTGGQGWVHYRVEMDGEHFADFELAYLRGLVHSEKLLRRIPVNEGSHTVKVSRLWWTGDQPRFFYGGVERLDGGGVSAAHMGVRE